MASKLIYALAFCLLLCSTLFSQSPSDPISASGLNEKYLEHLIKEKIDAVRLEHSLPALYNDSILYVAGKDQAQYMYKKGALSHFQPENPIMETPQKRADFYGAVNYLVGENVAVTYINTPTRGKHEPEHTNTTYEQTATDLVTMWVHSPGHFKNIITPAYNATGLAIWIDTKTNAVYAAQEFAQILYKYSFTENKAFFDYSNYQAPPVITSFANVSHKMHKGRHAWRLKTVKDSSVCKRCSDNRDRFAFGMTHIEHRGNAIYLASYSYEPIFEMLKKRKDGFAAELVVYDPYDCGNPAYYTNPSRRNKQCVFSGTVLKPIYRKKALRGFKPGGKNRKAIQSRLDKGKVKKYELKLGKVPKSINGYYEVNLVVIQKKRVCQVMHFSSYCGDTLKRFYELPFYGDSISNSSTLPEEYRNTTFTIPFQKGKTDYNMSDLRPLTDSLLSARFVADTIVIRAYASIEGNEILNKKLQEQRAANIAKAISSQQEEKLYTIINAEENWALFDKQIAESKDLAAYKALSHEKIKALLEDTLEQRRIEKYLAKQRSASIRLHAREVPDQSSMEKYLLAKIGPIKTRITRNLASEINMEKVPAEIGSLYLWMEIAYNAIRDKTLRPEFFKNFDISRDRMLNQYNLDKLRYWIQINGTQPENMKWLNKVYDELASLSSKGDHSFFVSYNLVNIVQRHGDELDVDMDELQQNQYISMLKQMPLDSAQSLLVTQLGLNLWFSVCVKTEQEQPADKLLLHKASLQHIHDYFKDKPLTQADLNKLAAYYLYHSKNDWVYELLWPEYQQHHDNPEGLKLLGKLLYQNYEETGNTAYYVFLQDLYKRIGRDNWCPMFVGPCNISFQAFDYELFRDFYCEKCQGYLNAAKAPVSR